MKALLGITTYSNKLYIQRCIEDITTRTLYPHDIYVHHNKSEDDPQQVVRRSVETKARYLCSSSSLNLSTAINRVLEASRDSQYEFAVYCNDDISVPPPVDGFCWLAALAEFFSLHPEIGAVSPTWAFGESTGLDHYSAQVHNWSKTRGMSITSPGIQGFCVGFSRKLLNTLFAQGYLFDDRFPLMWEDCELLYRVHKLGFKSAIYDYIPFYHYGSQTVGSLRETNSFYQRGKTLFHELTGAPQASIWTVSNSIYRYKINSNDRWILHGVP
jgi:GT2 family glycosyltransferase